jgi:hypothetical protein
MSCWYQLNLNINNSIKDDWMFPIPTNGQHGIWRLETHDIFKEEWINYIKTLGLDFDNVMLFYRGPGLSSTSAHIDICNMEPLEFSTCAVNWVIGGEGSEMVWYDIPPGDLEIKYTEANTPFIQWDINSLNKIDSCKIKENPTLVKVSIPHGIVVGEHGRWCISARPLFENTMFDWDQIVSKFKSTRLLVERS